MWPIIAGLVGAVITAIVTYVVAKRAKSGKIETSEAKDLWDTLRAELARQSEDSISLRTELNVNRTEMAALREETSKLRINQGVLEREIAELKLERSGG